MWKNISNIGAEVHVYTLRRSNPPEFFLKTYENAGKRRYHKIIFIARVNHLW